MLGLNSLEALPKFPKLLAGNPDVKLLNLPHFLTTAAKPIDAKSENSLVLRAFREIFRAELDIEKLLGACKKT